MIPILQQNWYANLLRKPCHFLLNIVSHWFHQTNVIGQSSDMTLIYYDYVIFMKSKAKTADSKCLDTDCFHK